MSFRFDRLYQLFKASFDKVSSANVHTRTHTRARAHTQFFGRWLEQKLGGTSTEQLGTSNGSIGATARCRGSPKLGISYQSIATLPYLVITLSALSLSLPLSLVLPSCVPSISSIGRITLGSQRRRRRHGKHDNYNDETPIA